MATTEERLRIVKVLDDLNATEQTISTRRRNLHTLIDSIYLRAPLEDLDVTLLTRLEEEEQVICDERRQLHARIDELRDQLGLPIWRERSRVSAGGFSPAA